MRPTLCHACDAPLPARAGEQVCLACGRAVTIVDDGAPPPRARFRDPIVIRPQIGPGRRRVGGGKAWPLVIALLLLMLGVPLILLVARAASR